jgi:hypothetical protein
MPKRQIPDKNMFEARNYYVVFAQMKHIRDPNFLSLQLWI